MKEYLLDAPVTKDFFEYLGNFGHVESLPHIREGFYKFEKPDWFSVRGLAGDPSVEVRFRKEVMDLTSDFLYLVFASYGRTDISALKQMERAVGERVRMYLYGK